MLQFCLGPLKPPLGDIWEDFSFIQFTPLHLTISFQLIQSPIPHMDSSLKSQNVFYVSHPSSFSLLTIPSSFPPFFHFYNSSLPLSFSCFIFLAAFRTECVQGRLLPLNCTHLSVSKPLGLSRSGQQRGGDCRVIKSFWNLAVSSQHMHCGCQPLKCSIKYPVSKFINVELT